MDGTGEKIIGVVAGAGPLAGLDLLRKILDQTVAARDQDHLTVISLSRPSQIPDRTEFLLGHTDVNPAYAILDQLQALTQLGVELAAVPCNTAHAPPIFDVVQTGLRAAGSRLQFLHMIEETADFLHRYYPHLKRVGILSTTGTYRARVYPSILESAGFKVLVPPLELQEQTIHPAIYAPEYGIKTCGYVTERARHSLIAGVDALRQAGAQAIILGCTEIPLAIHEKKKDGTIIVDPTLVLARALIREASPARLKPWNVD